MDRLRSPYLAGLSQAFAEKPRSALECTVEGGETVTDEFLEAVQYVTDYGLYLYHVLSVWGDGWATYVIRECRKKRMYKLVSRVPDFVLLVEPALVVDTFEWAARELKKLRDPNNYDAECLAGITRRWHELSGSRQH